MLDYEKYGNSFRMPKSLRPMGGPSNNGFNGYDGDPAKPDGRPRSPAGGMVSGGGRPRPEAGPTKAPPQEPNIHQQPVEQPTFLALQRQGLPRPPQQQPSIHQQGWEQPLPPAPRPLPSYDPRTNAIGADGSRGLEQQLRDAWQNYQSPGAFAGSAARANLPDAYQGQNFNDEASFEDLPTAYQGQQFGGRYSPTEAAAMRETGQFADPTGRIMGRTEQSVMDALDNPSAYNSDVVKNTFGLLAGEVDDDYNARDQALMAQAARRGLGGVGDSTVIANDARFQNLQRRSAKEGIATNLLDKQATVFGQDRAAAIAQAMGFGGQQFGQARDAYTTNRATDESNFGRDMTRRGFTADENARKFGFDMDAARFNEDVGQRGFENATTRARGMNDISQQRLDNRFRNTGYNNEVGQQGYQNRFARSAAENDLNQRDFDNSRSAYNTNRDAEAQGFSQKQQLLQQLLGYGQQGFENQVTTGRENDRREREQQELLLKLMGYA